MLGLKGLLQPEQFYDSTLQAEVCVAHHLWGKLGRRSTLNMGNAGQVEGSVLHIQVQLWTFALQLVGQDCPLPQPTSFSPLGSSALGPPSMAPAC